MAPSVCPVLPLAVLLSLAVAPCSAPPPWGRGGWMPNSAGYLLGPVLLPQSANQDGKKVTTLESLWKAIAGLPYFHPQPVSKRTQRETLAKPEIGDLGVLVKNIPREGAVLPS